MFLATDTLQKAGRIGRTWQVLFICHFILNKHTFRFKPLYLFIWLDEIVWKSLGGNEIKSNRRRWYRIYIFCSCLVRRFVEHFRQFQTIYFPLFSFAALFRHYWIFFISKFRTLVPIKNNFTAWIFRKKKHLSTWLFSIHILCSEHSNGIVAFDFFRVFLYFKIVLIDKSISGRICNTLIIFWNLFDV